MANEKLTPEQRDKLFRRIVEYSESTDNAFDLDGPIMGTVKREDGTFRKRTLEAEPFYLQGIYVGKRNDPILIFVPENPADYASFEVALKDADKMFPMFSALLGEFCKSEYLAGVGEDDLMIEVIDKTEDSVRLFEIIIGHEEHHLEHAAERELEEMKQIPGFGSF